MILVDSSVWIDYFRGNATPQTDKLDELLQTEPLAMGDLILVEVLQGFVADSDFATAKRVLGKLTVIELAGEDIALQSAQDFRKLRKRGITVRKTIDTIIATRCIVSGHELLHGDRNFDPFAQHLGLRVVS